MDWLKEKIIGAFAPKYIGSLVRTVLALAAGWLISLGVPADQVAEFKSATEPVLIGVLTALVTLGWSFIQKKKNSD